MVLTNNTVRCYNRAKRVGEGTVADIVQYWLLPTLTLLVVWRNITMKCLWKSMTALLLCFVMIFCPVLTACDSEDRTYDNATGKPMESIGSGESAEDSESTEDSENNGGSVPEYPEASDIPVTNVSLNETVATLLVGGTFTLTATVSPFDATDKRVVWSSSNSAVASVSNGVVTANSVGTATITVETSNGKSATCEVTVEKLQNLNYQLGADESYYVVSGIGECEDSKIVIPNMYNGLPVTEIGAYAFKNANGIASVTLGENIKIIRTGAFGGCRYLNTVKITSAVEKIEALAFYYCTSLENINLDSAIKLKKIGEQAFAYCSSLKEIKVPDLSVLEEIERYAFSNCTSLENINLDSASKLKKIGEQAFAYC